MPPIHTSHSRPAFPVGQALRCVDNPDQLRLDCLCGHCPATDDINYTDLALDACLVGALDLVDAMKNSQVKRDAGDRLSLHSLHGLLTHGRLLCCAQRHLGQAEDVHGG